MWDSLGCKIEWWVHAIDSKDNMMKPGERDVTIDEYNLPRFSGQWRDMKAILNSVWGATVYPMDYEGLEYKNKQIVYVWKRHGWYIARSLWKCNFIGRIIQQSGTNEHLKIGGWLRISRDEMACLTFRYVVRFDRF